MPFTSGGDPSTTVKVGIEGDADEAAAKIEQQIADAFADALRSPKVRAAFDAVAKNIGNQINKSLDASFRKPFASAGRDAGRVLGGITRDLQKVATAADKAFRFGAGRGAPNELQAVNATVAAIARNFDELKNASSATLRSMEEEGRQTRAALAGVLQELRRGTDERIQQARERSAILQREQTEISANARLEAATVSANSQRTIATFRLIRETITSTFRFAGTTVRTFGRVFDQVMSTISRVASSTFRGISAIVRGTTTAITAAFRGIGRGVGAALAGVSRAIASALRRDESAYRQSFARRERDLHNSLGRQAAATQRFQRQQQTGLLGGLGGAGLLGGLAAGGGLLGFLTGGFERAGQEELLQLTFTTLLQDGDKAVAVLQKISDFARTTSFDFVEVAGSVAQLTAALGNVDEAFDLTSFLADVVALTGGTTESLGRVRLAITQIASAGRLDAANLRQLTESLPGVPFAQILADRFFGGDVAAYSAARDAGELGATISAEAFFDAFEQGVQERFPEVEGFAQTAAGTLTGLTQNLKENVGIFGATLIRLVEGPLKGFIGATTNFLASAGDFVTGVQRISVFDPSTGDVVGTLAPLEGRLAEIRSILGNIVKSLGLVFGFLGSLKLLQLGFIALTSPLGLVVTAVSAFVGGLTFLAQRSTLLSNGLTFLGHRLQWLGYFVKSTFSAFVNLGSAIFDLFRGTGVSGGRSLFTKMGDQIARIVGALNRGLKALRDWANWAADMVRAGNISDVFRDISDKAQILLGTLLGLNEDEISWSRFLNGNDFSNIFTTFLDKVEEIPVIGPITAFARRVIDALSNAIGNIWDVVFGGDDGGGGGPGARFRGEESLVDEGFGTRLLDALEDTFLGPIVRFFRGTFSNGVETVIAQAVDIFRGLVDGIEAVWRVLEPILDPITDAFRDFFTVFREEGAGAAFGSLGRGLLDTLGNIGSTIAGLIGDIPGALESAVETAKPFIEEKLGPIWDTITGWFADTFSIENLLAAGDFILDFLYEVGFYVGVVLGDPATWAALAGAAAAVILILAQFFLGVFQGVVTNGGQWADIIVGGINAALGGILPEDFFDNGALSTAIGIAIAAAIAVGLTLALSKGFRAGGGGSIQGFSFGTLGASIASSLVGAIGREFTALWRGGAAIFTNNRARVTGDNTVFSGIGQKIGGAILGGIGIAFAGYQIGQNVSGPGGLLLGALMGAGTGAALGTAIAPGIGTALGAAIGGALGLISAEFGQGAEKAREMREQVALLADELEGLTGLDLEATLAGNLSQGAIDLGLGDLFADADFSFRGMAEDIIEGSADVRNQLAIFLDGLKDDAADLGISGEDFNAAFQNFFESGLSLDNFIANGLEGSDVFVKLGVNGRTAGELIGYFTDQIKLGTAAIGQLGGPDAVESIDTVAEAVEQLNASFSADATGRVRATADAIVDMLNKDDLTTQERIEAVAQIADDARDAVSRAKDEILELLGVQLTPPTLPEIKADFTTQLPSIESEWQSVIDRLNEQEITPQLAADFKLSILGDFRGDIESTIGQAIQDGLITSPADLTNFIADLRTGISESGLGDDLTTQLLGQLDLVDPAAFAPLFLAMTTGLQQEDLATEVINQLTAGGAEGGAQAAAAFNSSFNAGLGGIVEGFTAGGIGPRATGGASGADAIGATITGQIGDSITANSSDITDGITDAATAAYAAAESSPSLTAGAPGVGKTIANELGAGVTTNQGLITAATATAVNAAVLTAAAQAGLMFQVGVNLGNALARGLRSQLLAAAAAAAAVARGVAQAARDALEIKSPSKVFADIGRDIGRGFIQGIKDAEGDMVEGLASALENAVNQGSRRAHRAIRSAQVGQTIFDSLVPSVLPGGASMTAIQTSLAEITQSIAGLLAQLREQAGSTFGADAGAAFNARVGAAGAQRGIADALRDVVLQLNEARKQRDAIADFDRKVADLEARRARGALTQAAFEDAIKELGARPVALTPDQINLLQTGSATLDPRSVAGQANVAALQQALESIRSFGQAAIQAGTPIAKVIEQMRTYINGIIQEARARGLNVDQVRSIIDQLGLSTADLAEYQRQLLSLDISTISGATNVAQINEQLLAIRAYASELLAAGYSAGGTADQVKKLRDQLIAQATAFGFSATQIQALVNQAGLSNAALAEFIRQLQNFNNEARNAEAVARQAAEEAAKRRAAEEAKRKADEAAAGQSPATPPTPSAGSIDRPLVENLNLYLPSGDPDANALAVLNRLSYGLLG